MSGNTFGTLFRLTTFGESHGAAVGGVVDGMPPGIDLDLDFIQHELDRRRPGQSQITTPRDEKDKVKILSGIFGGQSTGTPIGFVVENTNQHSADYSNIVDTFRPSHADYTFWSKFGVRDHRGGGRTSARETTSRVAGGAIAKLLLHTYGIEIKAFTKQVGQIKLDAHYLDLDLDQAETNIVRCPDAAVAERMIEHIEQVRGEKDSVGGVVTCVAKNVPVGLGEPCFDKLQALLAHAMLSINAAKGFEYGSGFDGAGMRGSAHNDIFCVKEGRIRTKTNRSGGIQGGVANGEDIYFNVAFKPTATILMEQDTVNSKLEEVRTTVKGRHDPCVVPRAVPIVEAMTALVLADALLMNRSIGRMK